MAEEIAFENGQISNFDGEAWPWIGSTAYRRASLIDFYVHSEIEETFCGWTDVRIHWRTFETAIIRLTLLKSRPKNKESNISTSYSLLTWQRQAQVMVRVPVMMAWERVRRSPPTSRFHQGSVSRVYSWNTRDHLQTTTNQPRPQRQLTCCHFHTISPAAHTTDFFFNSTTAVGKDVPCQPKG